MEEEKEKISLRIAVLGHILSDKSQLIFRFINNKLPDEHDTIVEDSYTVPVDINNIKCTLEILDTAGEDDYQNMFDDWVNSSDGFVLVYSIDSRDSFESMKIKYGRILKLKGDRKVSIIIVGNKCELEEERKVSKEEAENFCLSNKVPFLEVSALKDINVKETFLTVAKGILRIKFPEKYKNSGKNRGKEKCYCF